MRCLIQRVSRSSVTVDSSVTGKSGKGMMILLGVAPDDDESVAQALAKKAVNLRIFDDADGKMNLSLLDVQGSALIVSQFTLYADCRRGNRPSYIGACEPEKARILYEYFCACVEQYGVEVGRGVFGADMKVELVNEGPVTVLLDSDILIKR